MQAHLAAAGLVALLVGVIVLFWAYPRLLVFVLLAIGAVLAYGALYLILVARMDPRPPPGKRSADSAAAHAEPADNSGAPRPSEAAPTATAADRGATSTADEPATTAADRAAKPRRRRPKAPAAIPSDTPRPATKTPRTNETAGRRKTTNRRKSPQTAGKAKASTRPSRTKPKTDT